MESVQELKAEIARLRNLLEASQREVHASIIEKAEFLRAEERVAIITPRGEIERREVYEADLRLALEETKEELTIVERTYNALLGEAEAELADLKSK
jgi:hypothetical protein